MKDKAVDFYLFRFIPALFMVSAIVTVKTAWEAGGMLLFLATVFATVVFVFAAFLFALGSIKE